MTIGEHVSGTITFYDGTAAITLSDANVISASTKRQCCADGAFEMGGVYAATLSMVCRLPGVTSFALRGAKVALYSQYDTESSPEPMGVFWITNARRKGEIFTISGQDGIGWTDTSCYNDSTASIIDGCGGLLTNTAPTIEAWLGTTASFVGGTGSAILYLVNILIARSTGIQNMLTWEDYNESANNNEPYCGKWVYVHYPDNTWERTTYPQNFPLYRSNGLSTNDCPRDFMRYLAQLTGGFITTKRNGALTLRMFRMPEFGTAVVSESEMEMDSEIADYRLVLQRVNVRSEIDDAATEEMDIQRTPEYDHVVNIRYLVESNPFLDGFVERWIHGEQTVPNVWTIAHNLYYSFHYYNNDMMQVRPFRAKVHKAYRFELGQKIQLTQGGQTYTSLLTSIGWTFRGGYTIACGGEDSRVMADCIRATKADKALRELRSRFKAL